MSFDHEYQSNFGLVTISTGSVENIQDWTKELDDIAERAYKQGKSFPLKVTKKELFAERKYPPAAGMGRPKGAVNKTTALLKDAILKAATDAGNGDMAAYLERQALENPGPFMALLGKVLPMQVTGLDDGPIQVTRIELTTPK